jgi:polyisoprenoid-binding protein YceI
MADITHYTVRPTSESSVSAQLFQSGLPRGRKHVLFLEHYRGKVAYDNANVENSRVELIFEATDLVCRDNRLTPAKQQRLLSFVQNEILAAEHHPQITFCSSRIQKTGWNQFDVEGLVTVRGQSKPMTLKVTAVRMGSNRLEIDGRGELKLSDYGAKTPRTFFGLMGIQDQVVLRFLLWPERVVIAERASVGAGR